MSVGILWIDVQCLAGNGLGICPSTNLDKQAGQVTIWPPPLGRERDHRTQCLIGERMLPQSSLGERLDFQRVYILWRRLQDLGRSYCRELKLCLANRAPRSFDARIVRDRSPH